MHPPTQIVLLPEPYNTVLATASKALKNKNQMMFQFFFKVNKNGKKKLFMRTKMKIPHTSR